MHIRLLTRLVATLFAAFVACMAQAFVAQAAAGIVGPLTPQERVRILRAVQAEEPTEAPSASLSDGTLIAMLQRYATLELGLRTRPQVVDRMWAIAPPWRAVTAELDAARMQGRLGEWIDGLSPQDERYVRLQAERCRYRAIVDAGGWPTLPPTTRLKPGDVGPLVALLRVRLEAESYFMPPAVKSDLFDADLAAALRAFQMRHDLASDGVIGSATLRELNIPAEARLLQIEINLERWRWLPHKLPADRIEVDVGGQEATLYVSGRAQLEMRAIVGAPKRRTPMFASRVEAVVINPPWNVPDSIARNEIWPRVARDPGYLARQHMVKTASGLQQTPGPWNALGRLKFDLPSPFGVYLHDTPSRSLFARRDRALSHGCIRLEKPQELALALLGRQGWAPADLERAMRAGSTRRIDLQTTTPLFVVYWTAVVGEDGWVSFRTDIYGWDKRLALALAQGQLVAGEVMSETECSASMYSDPHSD